jgi:hypothetical protein
VQSFHTTIKHSKRGGVIFYWNAIQNLTLLGDEGMENGLLRDYEGVMA